METKDPGYYRKLMESIEASLPETTPEAATPVNEDRARAMSVAMAIRNDLGKALQSQDPQEIERLVQGAYNSMEEILMLIRQGGMNEMGYGSRGPRRGDTVYAGVGTTLTRHAGTDDEEELDVWITFDATITDPGYAGDRTDPGSGSEWEFEISTIEIDMPKGMKPAPGEDLTPEEIDQLTAWFNGPEGQARAEEAANDKYDPFEQGDH
jgi:hypothetical protein